ncbi:hypothetical protein BX661DRAFT_179880 [Kickxella alabastrina]|uniref:uncharacterized protein n=1 Tax=Kickxella alabastrina TaxID=61397 RepID=UPI00221FE80B|nr:uncharacterized protein BX661DRAFT_179880 [Kickxella alabastrina]KAI7832145.1 hypothetical protein BX661DRAFT_179880 [Kickxella alabastrina]
MMTMGIRRMEVQALVLGAATIIRWTFLLSSIYALTTHHLVSWCSTTHYSPHTRQTLSSEVYSRKSSRSAGTRSSTLESAKSTLLIKTRLQICRSFIKCRTRYLAANNSIAGQS